MAVEATDLMAVDIMAMNIVAVRDAAVNFHVCGCHVGQSHGCSGCGLVETTDPMGMEVVSVEVVDTEVESVGRLCPRTSTVVGVVPWGLCRSRMSTSSIRLPPTSS